MITLPPHYGCLSRRGSWRSVSFTAGQTIKGIDCSYDGSIVYVLTNGKVYKSTDFALTFSELTAFTATGVLAGMNNIACNGDGSFICTVGSHTQWYSTDGGTTVVTNTLTGGGTSFNVPHISKTTGAIAVAGGAPKLWVSSTLGSIIDTSINAFGASEPGADCAPKNSGGGRYLALSTTGNLRDDIGTLIASSIGTKMASDGIWGGDNSTFIISTGTGSGLMKSASGGAFSTFGPALSFGSVGTDEDASVILAGPSSTDQLRLSTDGGGVFQAQQVPGSRSWTSCRSNFNGKRLLAFAAGQTGVLWVGHF